MSELLLLTQRKNKPVIDWSFMDAMPSGFAYTRAGAATYFDNAGVMQVASANVPRWDYDPITLERKGLLIETQSANLFINSDTPVTQSLTVAATEYTLSFFGAGSIVLNGARDETVVGLGAYPVRKARTFTPTAGTLTLTIVGDVQKVQFEASGHATSYISTGETTVTRAMDLLYTNDIAWRNQQQGTMVADYQLVGVPTSGTYPRSASFSDGSYNRVDLQCDKNGFSAYIRNSGSVQFDAARIMAASLTLPVRHALRYKTNDSRLAVNGTLGVHDLVCTLPTLITRLSFGSGNGASTHYGDMWLKRFRYWNSALTDAELQRITQ